MPMTNKIVLFATFLGVAAISGVARSDGKDAQTKEANTAFEKGKALFKAGDYAEAAEAFRKAYELRPAWKILYNIGQCAAADKRYGEAIEAFERYLAEGGDEVPKERQGSVIEEVTRLRNLVGFFEIEAEEGSAIFIDGVERGVAPEVKRLPVTATVEHEVYVVLNGVKGEVQRFKVTGGDTVSIDLTEKETEGPAPVEIDTKPDEGASQAAAEPPKSEESKRPAAWTIGWIALGTGVAALAGGAVTGALAISKDKDLEKSCEPEGCYSSEYELIDARDALASTSTALFISGGVIAATGATLLIVFRKDRGDVDVALAPGPGSIRLTGSF